MSLYNDDIISLHEDELLQLEKEKVYIDYRSWKSYKILFDIIRERYGEEDVEIIIDKILENKMEIFDDKGGDIHLDKTLIRNEFSDDYYYIGYFNNE